MAQDFSMRLPLVDGQGNFGSMDGDPPAAMRYTEARLAKAAEAILDDIDKDTVDWRPTYDESMTEPVGAAERACRTCWSTAPAASRSAWRRTFRRTIWARWSRGAWPISTIRTSRRKSWSRIFRGRISRPAARFLGRVGIRSAYFTGNGSVPVRAKCSTEDMRDKREAIIVHEIPYQVNKGKLLERLGEVGREKIVEDMAEVRDESDREGVRIVIELKKNAIADVVLNQLYKHTAACKPRFPCNMVALDHGRPQTMLLRDFIGAFVRNSVRRLLPAAQFLNWARRGTAPMFWPASPSPSQISTRLSR